MGNFGLRSGTSTHDFETIRDTIARRNPNLFDCWEGENSLTDGVYRDCDTATPTLIPSTEAEITNTAGGMDTFTQATF